MAVNTAVQDYNTTVDSFNDRQAAIPGEPTPMFAAMCALSAFALSAIQFLRRRKRNET